jgi:hypothetical protein
LACKAAASASLPSVLRLLPLIFNVVTVLLVNRLDAIEGLKVGFLGVYNSTSILAVDGNTASNLFDNGFDS